MKTQTKLASAARYAIKVLGKIPAFGNGIGDEVSKAQIGIAHKKLCDALNDCENTKPQETEYQKALRTGEKPAIWPPLVMSRDDLNHFRATHGIGE